MRKIKGDRLKDYREWYKGTYTLIQWAYHNGEKIIMKCHGIDDPINKVREQARKELIKFGKHYKIKRTTKRDFLNMENQEQERRNKLKLKFGFGL
jgi:hypothetical protein